MKLSIATATALPLLASGYTMGGFGRRPVIITNAVGPCGPGGGRCAPSNADQAFSDLQKELNSGGSSSRRSRSRSSSRRNMQMNKEDALRQQQEWLNRAFGLATEAASAMAGVDVKESNEALRQQQEWLNRAFGIATNDVASGMSSPRYQVNDNDQSFQVQMDVPGVKQSDIDITMEENVLTIKGEREVGMGDVSRTVSFSKSFTLDANVETDKITAQLNNGVLLVTAPKDVPVVETKKIPVMQVTTEDDDEESAAPAENDADKTMGSDDVIDAEANAEETESEKDESNASDETA